MLNPDDVTISSLTFLIFPNNPNNKNRVYSDNYGRVVKIIYLFLIYFGLIYFGFFLSRIELFLKNMLYLFLKKQAEDDMQVKN